MTKASAPNNPSANIELSAPATKTMVEDLVSLICLIFHREQTATMNQLYWTALSDLTTGQIKQLALVALREIQYWPSPAQLRRLVGIPSEEEKAKLQAEQQDLEAKADLEKLLKSLRPFSRDQVKRARWIANLKAKYPVDPITKTLTLFGGGSLDAGVEILVTHPVFQYADEDKESLGLTLNTIDRMQKVWISLWKEANR